MRVISLGSGSSGNALLVEAGPQGRTRLLVDAGLSARLLTQRLSMVGVDPRQLSGILVTHEHSDHATGIPVLTQHYGVPVIADARTYTAIEESIYTGLWRTDSGKLAPTVAERDALTSDPQSQSSSTQFIAFPVGSQQVFGDIEVTSFPISHDAIAPCGYLLRAGGCRICLVTDSGEVTPAMLSMMQHADLLILESNHDRERLIRGPYPWSLKNRILSPTGHLSNDQAADAVLRTWVADGVRWLWLAHLSRTNNTPTLALESMRVHLLAANANPAHIHLSALPPGMGPIWDSTQLWSTQSLWDM